MSASSGEFEPFNAITVPLADSNLIEASAGTGKTYSIAILVLRLILEKRVLIKEILMVTFTRAAVAELEERIRLFIRQAYRASAGGKIADATIAKLVNEAIDTSGAEAVQTTLREAVLFLDETSVLTIHSFCQMALSEFAFETGQLFNSEILQDTSAIISDEVNKFWRKYVTTIPADLLRHLLSERLSRDLLGQIIKDHLNGKKYFGYDEGVVYDFCQTDHDKYWEDFKSLEAMSAELRSRLSTYIIENRNELITITNGNANARKNILPFIDQPGELVTQILKKRNSKYIENLYSEILEQCDACEEAEAKQRELLASVIHHIGCFAINQVSAGVRQYKERNNQISFDDMIVNLHHALTSGSHHGLKEGLKKKYKAVFIDEFQDTDRLQYEIFQEAFAGHTLMFYIGDPKQSIYAWRKADIHTYFKASLAVSHRYGMNTNYRSSSSFIQAMNEFFKPAPDFDTFYFSDSEQTIEYLNVSPPKANSRGSLFHRNELATPITITCLPNKSAICHAVAAQVADLLNKEHPWFTGEATRLTPVSPSDIGILVRKNSEGRLVKNALAKYGIPAVTIGDEKVLRSEEAKHLLFLLEAMNETSLSNINRALLSPFTGYTIEQILTLDDEQALDLFSKYHNVWLENGIYTALMTFIRDYAVHDVLRQSRAKNGERVMTNLLHLTELLHQTQIRKKLSPAELISWLRRGVDGMVTEGDEYEQRVESDEEAVRIVTIHKSKGLEYKIVLAPFLDLLANGKQEFCSFRDAVTGEYVSASRNMLSEEQTALVERQEEQENRRLMYVAITRAVYKCFIYKNMSNGGIYKYSNSSLAPFVTACSTLNSPFIEFADAPEILADYFYDSGKSIEKVGSRAPVAFSLREKYWRRMSYSLLRAQHEVSTRPSKNNDYNEYDEFIFRDLVKGARTGNLLHFIFENIRFNDRAHWPYVIAEAVKRFAPSREDLYSPMLALLLDHVLQAPCSLDGISFTLSELSPENQLHEFEFDFPVALFNSIKLEMLSEEGQEIHIANAGRMEGVMNGKIDLFFECQGKFFVLDWKSNFLGDSVADYSREAVTLAMNENNYHLQYLIYTLAVSRYLSSRLPSFDYERDFGGVIYLFVRGVRKGTTHGIFTCRPSLMKIKYLEQLLGVPEDDIMELV